MDWLLSRIGIGAAEVSMELSTERVTPGDSITADVAIEGESADQTGEYVATRVSATTTLGQSIAGADVPRYPTRTDMEIFATVAGIEDNVDPVMEYTMDWEEIAGEIAVGSGDRWTTTTTIDVPHSTPLTMGGIHVWTAVGMYVPVGRDPFSERHYLEVRPDDRFEALFEAAAEMGMEYGGTKFHEDASPSTFTERTPFTESEYSYPLQLFRFHPTEAFAGLDAVDLTVLGTETGLEVDVELRPGPDGKRTVEFETTDVDAVRAKLASVLDRMA